MEGGGKGDLDDFKSTVQVWLQLDLEIEKLQEKIKEYRKQKEKITPKILDFMEKKGHKDIQFKDATIRYRNTKTKQTITKDYLIKTLYDYFKDEMKAVDATKYLLENRKITEKTTIERK
jgi:hypothetical protein